MPRLPNALLLIVMVAVFVGSVNSTTVTYRGHVYCCVTTYGTNGNSTEVLPVKNVDMKLMEWDLGTFFDSDDQLGTCRTEADGTFYLTGHEFEPTGLEPYLIVKACRIDDPSICSVEEKSIVDDNGFFVMEAENANVYLDNDFCHQICTGGVCQCA